MFDRKTFAKICLPALFGLGFVGIVWMNHALFRTGVISPGGAIGIELLYLLAFIGVVIGAVISTLRNIHQRPILWSALALASIVLGLWFVGVGIENGAAIVYAT